MRYRTMVYVRLLSSWLLLLTVGPAVAQDRMDSWATVQQRGGGTVTALWYDADPFIFKDAEGILRGVEYELMESFAQWVKRQYGYDLKVNWADGGSFLQIYNRVADATDHGLFGWSFFSITPQRQQQVAFTPPYMPDINVLITNDQMPLFTRESEFYDTLAYLKGYTMYDTSMETDMDSLLRGYDVPVSRAFEDYAIVDRIAIEKEAFGYVPLTVYVVSLQRGIKVKRQHLFATERPGLAGILPRHSDWQPIVNEYFQSFECKRLANLLLNKYLGSEIGEIIMNGPGATADSQRDAELELLAREREIVSQRLAQTLLAAERAKTIRNVSILLIFIAVVFVALLYNRYRMKNRLTKLLTQRNTVIGQQNRDIERINRQLHMRVLQAQINPHFVFNSLNDLQYYINKGDSATSMRYVSRFSRFIRELLTHANEPEISLAQEKRFLELYLDLEKMRYTDRFDYRIDVEDGTPPDIAGIPPLIIYHYVENALYHGILNLEGKGEISISFAYRTPYLVCTVLDNGCGREAARRLQQQRDTNDTTPYKGLLRDRIQVLNEEMSGRITVLVQDLVSPDGEPAGTRVTLHLLVSSRAQELNIFEY